MKKITLVGAAIWCLLAAALNCSALKQDAPPSPAETANRTRAKHSDDLVMVKVEVPDNVFVGHYGEVFRFNEHFMVEPEMQDLMEVVRFHGRTRETEKGAYARFEPKREEYVPRNFTPLNLAQLFVIPKNVPNGFRSLKKLRAAKEKELAASGLHYKFGISDYSGESDLWPQDTFGVMISTPYQLFQLYTQSDKSFFIFTTGVFDPSHPTAGDFLETFDSLQKYLKQFQRQVSEDYLVYRNPRLTIPWVLIIVIAGALSLLPNRTGWRDRLRLIGRATLAFSTMLPLIGLSAICLSVRYGLDKWVNMGSTLCFIAAILPFLYTALSAWLGGRRLWRVFLWMSGINVLPVYVTFLSALQFYRSMEIMDAPNYVEEAIILIFMGLLSGLCFGLTHAQSEASTVSGEISR